ncbi:glycine cleavage system aminomethyltransferase GcvT [Mobilitalea sibirica]|uniref:Aminomethyltransferase n=1 Tax=Mobilitalea sibirica TaxID=1462919 RepID=A0A8J7KZF4_9FIRM|nr:glycine cleavage system aminomethyltransferase GcvT [Mobilitalea sibirica]MBH1940098.1 glycine cleavage system aminomethyltransferase GcvT [Mobilitalea sibirica]
MEMKTPLYECHVRAKGKLVPFAGYLLPVQYETGVIEEHMAVRTAAGLFDVSHMGEVTLTGNDALFNVQRLVTNDCSQMVDGQVKYSPMCNEEGGIVDDLLIYRKSRDSYLLVINAANRHKDVAWIKEHLTGEVDFEDISDQVAQLALQGPMAKSILGKITEEAQLPVKYYSFAEHLMIAGIDCLVSRTGYTGEDGYELYCHSQDAVKLWKVVMEAGEQLEAGLIPCGLGARDTLRLEAAMPLYGHEMDDTISPLETGLGFAVKLNKEDFIGKAAIIAKGKPTKVRVGLDITGRGIARENCPVYYKEELIGRTTSGTHCPYLGRPVAMALLDCKYSEASTQVEVEVRGRRISAQIVDLPFYKRSR